MKNAKRYRRVTESKLTVVQEAVRKETLALKLGCEARILDAPCGGFAALTLALREEGLATIGADLDMDAASVLGSSFTKADLNSILPWPAETFDAVISTEGIEHLENHYSFLREVARVLKPGGFLLLTTPNITALRSRVRFFFSGFFGRDGRPLNEAKRSNWHHIGLATFPELRYEFHVSDLRIVRATHTHIKWISYCYAIYAPWMWLYTKIAFRREKDPAQRLHNREILGSLLSPSLLFGECLLLVARKNS